jgi:GT2 family glycosyltransferase
VDNCSEDGSVEATLEHYPEVSIIRIPENLGYCMVYNLAMPQAFADGCEWVIWANNDILIEADCLREMARVAQRDSRIGVVGPAFLAWEGDDPNCYMLGNHPYAIPAMKAKSCEPIGVEWVEGSFLMVRRRCVENVGPLDPYLYFYWEEADFCRRARHQGWQVVLAPSALARHYAGGWSAHGGKKSAATARLQSRNYFVYKLANPLQSMTTNFGEALHLFLVILKRCLFSKPEAAGLHLRVFAGILRDLPPIYKKWKRDREGKHPSPLREGMPCKTIRVIPGKKQDIPSNPGNPPARGLEGENGYREK